VKQKSHDISRVRVRNNLLNKLRERSITQKRLLYRLVTELSELSEEELLWRWQCSLSELELSELFEVVEIREVKSSNQAHDLLGFSLSLALRVTVEVDLRVGWH
jgi:hypothetical protein